MKLKKIITSIQSISLLLCFITVLAQEVDDKKKIHISITKEINGEKKTINRSYNSIEDMKNDPELLSDDFHFLFDEDGNLIINPKYHKFGFFNDFDEEGIKHFKFKMDDEDGNIFFDHNSDDSGIILKNFNGIRHFKFDGDGTFEFHNNGNLLELQEDEKGNYYFERDGEKIEMKKFHENGIHHFDEENDDGVLHKRGFYMLKDGKIDEHFQEIMLELKSFGFGGDLESLEKEMEFTLDLKNGENSNVRVIVRQMHKILIEDLDNAIYENLHQDKEILDLKNLAYFPNPSEGKFRLRFNADVYPIQIKILDLTGREVYTEMNHGFEGFYDKDIDLSGKDPGIYFLQIIQNDKISTKKLLIE